MQQSCLKSKKVRTWSQMSSGIRDREQPEVVAIVLPNRTLCLTEKTQKGGGVCWPGGNRWKCCFVVPQVLQLIRSITSFGTLLGPDERNLILKRKRHPQEGRLAWDGRETMDGTCSGGIPENAPYCEPMTRGGSGTFSLLSPSRLGRMKIDTESNLS